MNIRSYQPDEFDVDATVSELDLSGEGAKPRPILRLAFQITAFYFGIFIPFVCIAMASGGLTLGSDRWQSRKLSIYAFLLLEMPPILPALPLMLISMVALASFEIWPKTGVYIAVRVTIYLGTLVSFQYLCYAMVASMFLPVLISGVLIWPSMLAITLLFLWCFRKLSRIMILTASIAVLLSLAINLPSDINFVVFCTVYFVSGSVIGGPFGCFVTYLLVARRLFVAEYLRTALMNWFVSYSTAWIAWFASTSASITLMLDSYAKLPPNPPNGCFVCSAAAHGHPRIVHAQPVVISNQTHMINRQLKRLKFLEIVLHVVVPRSHRKIRGVYNRIGPFFARPARSNRWYADVCYLILKPLEWFAVVLQVTARVPLSTINSIYNGTG